jgi:puromycin-sensitive aminopeptidase
VAVDAYRLPRTVLPQHYDLELVPDLESARFTGTVAITVQVTEPVTEVLLNAQWMTIGEAVLTPAGGSPLTAEVSLDAGTERAHLRFGSTLPTGDAVLRLTFAGEINDKLTGFYRSTFTAADGTAHTIAVTQFEATHARKALPCWDEPELKATFSVTLVVPEALAAISNSAVVSEEPVEGGKRRVRFAETMKMSTYLLAFVVGPMEATAPLDVDGTPLGVAHPPGQGHLTDFALDSGAFALRYYTDYFGLPYPGDKLDLVAVPDFAFGAMENLGCVTFREALLLVDPARATQPELQNIADVIHHEIAHMWFGDLVTMKWWNGIWLNEAFATFMEMKCTDAYRPDWDRWTAFGLARTGAFDTDSLESTRPIEFEVVSPEEAEGMFDVLTYEKGAAVLRMLEQYLGEDRFRDGVRHYLSLHQYANTETTDLWDAIEAVTEEPVRHIADTWIFQGGYPVLTPTVAGDQLTLGQRRFRFATGDGGAGGSAEQTWAIPVLVRYGAGDKTADTKVLLGEAGQSFPLAFPPEWVLVNAGGSGFYRVAYTPDQLAALGARLAELSPLERYNLLDDAFSAVLAGTTSADDFLALCRNFAGDADVSVWQRMAGALGTLDRVVRDDRREALAAVVRDLAGPALTRLGWTPGDHEDDRTRALRGTLVELLGGLGADHEVQARSREILDDRGAAGDPALAAAAVGVLAETGGDDDFATFLERFRGATTPQEELRYLYSLPRFHTESAFGQLLELTMSEIRTQNAPFVLRSALANRTQGPVAWSFVKEHWEAINQRFPSSTIVRLLDGVRGLNQPAVAADVAAFFEDHVVPQGTKTLQQHLERLRVNVALREREHDRFLSG